MVLGNSIRGRIVCGLQNPRPTIARVRGEADLGARAGHEAWGRGDAVLFEEKELDGFGGRVKGER